MNNNQNGQHLHPHAQGSIDLVALLAVLWKRKVLILVCIVASLGAGTLYLWQETPVYLSTARLLVERQGVPIDKRGTLRHDQAFVPTQAEVVRSRAVVERACRTFTPGSIGPEVVDPVEAVLKALQVTPVESANVMRVSYRGPDAQEAVKFLEVLIDSYRDYLRESEEDSHLDGCRSLFDREKERFVDQLGRQDVCLLVA